MGSLTNVEHKLMHLSFWHKYGFPSHALSVCRPHHSLTSHCLSYHLRRFTDTTPFVAPPRPLPTNVYAQWRELLAAEAALAKKLTLMEVRQKERETVRGSNQLIYPIRHPPFLFCFLSCFIDRYVPVSHVSHFAVLAKCL